MSDSFDFAARLVDAGAPAYAAAAAERLLERHPEIAQRFGTPAFNSWRQHLTQRLSELSAALLAGDAELFAGEIAWARAAFAGRQVPVGDLRASLACLRDVLADELPAAAGEEPVRMVESGLAALDAAPEEDPAPAEAPERQRLALAYLEKALAGERKGAMDLVLSAVDGGLAVSDAQEALMAAQRQVGELWHAGEAAVAQEHFVTATTQGALAILAERARPAAAANGKAVLVAPAPGDGHFLASLLLAHRFERQGWRAVGLAGAVPADELALGVEAFAVDLLAMSLTVSTRLAAAITAVQRVRSRCPEVKILLGGSVPARSAAVRRRIGADAYPETMDEALKIGAQLVGL